MDARYWERVGDDYESEIFDSAKMDRRGVVPLRLDEFADPRAAACDFGCGVGHYLPLLSPRFRRVFGFDFAPSLLTQATRRCSGLSNVTIGQANLASGRTRLPVPRLRFGVCANVLISHDPRMRRAILRTIHRHLARRAHAMFVIPSLESVLWSNTRLVEWNERIGFSHAEAVDCGIRPSARNARELLDGLVRIQGVPTKHYLREEAEVFFAGAGFEIARVDKLEYGWDVELENPPRWLKDPGPWDWLFVVRKQE